MTDSPTRAGATRRPFLSAQWRDLAMLNFAIDPAVLAPFVPRGTELDAWHGITYVSIVGFRFLDTRLLGVPVPWHRDFEEVNLRFYVRRREGDELRRGVVFIREIVPRRAIAAVARAWYNEPYVAMPMRHRITRAPAPAPASAPGTPASGNPALETPALETPDIVSYGWQRAGTWEGFSLRVPDGAQATPIAPGSEAEYITEHYWGYTRQRDNGTIEYEVKHPRWHVWPAEVDDAALDIVALYGRDFAPALSQLPRSVFIADGSAITVHQPRRIA